MTPDDERPITTEVDKCVRLLDLDETPPATTAVEATQSATVGPVTNRALLLDFGDDELNEKLRAGVRAARAAFETALSTTTGTVQQPTTPARANAQASLTVNGGSPVTVVVDPDNLDLSHATLNSLRAEASILMNITNLNDLYEWASRKDGLETSPIAQAIQTILNDYDPNISAMHWMTSGFVKKYLLKFLRENRGKYGAVVAIFENDLNGENGHAQKLAKAQGVKDPAIIDGIVPTDRCSISGLAVLCEHTRYLNDAGATEFYTRLQHFLSLVEEGSPKAVFLQTLAADYTVHRLRAQTSSRDYTNMNYYTDRFAYHYHFLQQIPECFHPATEQGVATFEKKLNEITHIGDVIGALLLPIWKACFRDPEKPVGVTGNRVQAVLKRNIRVVLDQWVDPSKEFGTNRIKAYESLRTWFANAISQNRIGGSGGLDESCFQEELDYLDAKIAQAKTDNDALIEGFKL